MGVLSLSLVDAVDCLQRNGRLTFGLRSIGSRIRGVKLQSNKLVEAAAYCNKGISVGLCGYYKTENLGGWVGLDLAVFLVGDVVCYLENLDDAKGVGVNVVVSWKRRV